MATHSSVVAWKIPWTEEPGELTVHGVAKSRTQLRGLSTHKPTEGEMVPWTPKRTGAIAERLSNWNCDQ